MTSPLEEFRQHLTAVGKQLTKEREIIAKAVISLRTPFTPDTVLAAIGTTSRVSRATVYRTISMLTDSGQIQVNSQSDSEVVYSHSSHSPTSTGGLSHLCEAEHASLIAGKCPWCGRNIINGKPDDF